MNASAAVDLALREALDVPHPPDLRPLLHTKQRLPPVSIDRSSQIKGPVGHLQPRAAGGPLLHRRRRTSIQAAPTRTAPLSIASLPRPSPTLESAEGRTAIGRRWGQIRRPHWGQIRCPRPDVLVATRRSVSARICWLSYARRAQRFGTAAPRLAWFRVWTEGPRLAPRQIRPGWTPATRIVVCRRLRGRRAAIHARALRAAGCEAFAGSAPGHPRWTRVRLKEQGRKQRWPSDSPPPVRSRGPSATNSKGPTTRDRMAMRTSSRAMSKTWRNTCENASSPASTAAPSRSSLGPSLGKSPTGSIPTGHPRTPV